MLNDHTLSFTVTLDGDEYNVDIYPKPEGDKEYTLDGETLTVKGWARKLQIRPSRLIRRLEDYIPEVALDNAEYKRVSTSSVSRDYEYDGKILSISGWAAQLNISAEQVRHRLRRYPVDVALDNDKHTKAAEERRLRRYECSGKSLTTSEWSVLLGVSVDQIRHRLRRYSAEIALDNAKFKIAVEERRKASDRCRSRKYECDDKVMTVSEWSAHLGITTDRVYHRLKCYSPYIALNNVRFYMAIEKDKTTKHECDGLCLTVIEWAKRIGIPVIQMLGRFRQLPVEEAVNFVSNALKFTYDGKTLSNREWALELGVSVITFKNYAASHSFEEAVERYKNGIKRHKRRNAKTRRQAKHDNGSPTYPYYISHPRTPFQKFVKLPTKYAKFEFLKAYEHYRLTGDGNAFAEMSVSFLSFYCEQVRYNICSDEDIEDEAWYAVSIAMKNPTADKFESDQHIINYLTMIGIRWMKRIKMINERRFRSETEYMCEKSLITPSSFDDTLDQIIEQIAKQQKLSKRSISIVRKRSIGLTLEEISKKYKITRERVRQIEKKTIKIIREFVQHNEIPD
jgi:DNA-binding Lrp family transcriptional regulator